MAREIKCILFYITFRMNNDNFWSSLENTGWYEYIRRTLKYSNDIAAKIISNNSILIHCPEGSDYTLLLSSLSQILVDPYYRTIEGLAILIEKDWLSFGYQFGFRGGLFLKTVIESMKAPFFLLWLDCIHQLLCQFPNAFEFNNELLLFLADMSMSNLYGTFLFNDDRERSLYDTKIKTASIWSDVLIDKGKFTNLFYEKENISEIIIPNYASFKLVFWDEFFMKNSNFVINNSFYLDDSKSKKFLSQQEFYDWQKKEDISLIKRLEKEMELMNESLIEISKVFFNTEIFETFQENTKKFILSSQSLQS